MTNESVVIQAAYDAALAMLLAPRRSSTAGDFLRMVAVWLAVVVLFEGFTVVQSRAAGPLHRHQAVSTVPTLDHGHRHDNAARHFHYGASVQSATAEEIASLMDALDAATSALSMAFALLGVTAGIHIAQQTGRVWCATTGWAWSTASADPLLRPPQHR